MYNMSIGRPFYPQRSFVSIVITNHTTIARHEFFIHKWSPKPKENDAVLENLMMYIYCVMYLIFLLNNSHFLAFVLCLLLLIGNIEPNPGPNVASQPNITHGQLNIAHINSCSLLPKLDLIELEMSDNDIILVSETHLDKNIHDDDLLLKGFQKPIRKDRNRYGGGVAIYVNSNIYVCEKPEFGSDDLEILWVEINTAHLKAMVGVIYRPPQSDISFWKKLENNINPILDLNIPIFLGGDFNVDMLANRAGHLGNLLTRLNLENVVKEPTRITDTSATCIDLFVTNRLNFILDVRVLPNFCSDHCPVKIEVSMKISKQKSYKRKIRKYEQADFASISNELESRNWSALFENNSVNENYSQFLNILNETCDKYIPSKVVVIRPDDKPFMNSSIRKAIRKRNRVHYKAKTTNNPGHWAQYRALRNDVIKLVRDAKAQYKDKLTSQLIDKNIPPGKWWRIAKSVCKLNKCNRVTPPLNHCGRIVIHPSEKCDIFNKYFSNISHIDEEPSLPTETISPETNCPEFFISEQEVKDQLDILNSSKPSGPDGVAPMILKKISISLVSPLTFLFNQSLQCGRLPYIWKRSHVTPVYKNKGSMSEVSNFRPISLTCVLCKMMEKILVKHMHNYVLEHHIITKHQSGFQPKDSTVYQLLNIYNTILSNLDIGKDVRFLFCDVSKAFDRVWHRGLLFKLRKIGINGKLLNWITDYLDDRKQKVVMDGFSSGWEEVDAGVPQGSVLGPFLFLIYINNIIDGLNCNIKLFADDTSLFVIIDDQNYMQAADMLTSDLSHIHDWSKQWAIRFNPDKTESLLFTRRNVEDHTVYFGSPENPVKDVTSHTHLGLNFQNNCKWRDHINQIYTKACGRLNILRMLKYQVSRKVLINLYFSFIRPVIEYADIVWDNCTLHEANLLESVQVEAGRIITGLRVNSSKSKMYAELGWEPLHKRREKHKLILMYKIIHGHAPNYLYELFQPYEENVHSYNLRNQTSSDNLRIPFCNTISYEKSFVPSTIRLWNNLPSSTKSSPSVHMFKKKVKF